MLTGRSLVALLSAAVLLVSWYGWSYLRNLDDGIVTTDVIPSSVAEQGAARKPLDGAMDILLVGVDSRTDAQGKPLSDEVLALLNGGVADGTLNTDTMILVHIPQDGTRAVAVSFPRDAYVEIADGFGKHKLNSAMARQKNDTSQRLRDEGVTDDARIEREATQAGRRTLIRTIEGLTGGAVTVDRYAEVNLASFYEVTKAIGGVEVCLNKATSDSDSGADFQAGRQTIAGREALSFVRQRGGLPGGDLDRIVRQQVFIGALARQVLSTGTLTDFGKLDRLVTAVKKSVVLSERWNITEFAEQMQGLVSGNIQFRTIPVGEPTDTWGDGNVLPVDPARVRQFIKGLAGDSSSTSDPSAPSTTPSGPQPSAITVQVVNSSGVVGQGSNVLEMLARKGFQRGQATPGNYLESSVVRHAPGERSSADRVVSALGGNATAAEDDSVPRGQVQVYVGADFSPADESDPASAGGTTTTVTGTVTASDTPTPPITADGVVCVN
ncbi:LCP family protein required for cell wall assembly [Saccharothrix tamanrassetensis]|uniref:LCP family protein required for cell wall assembly n=1 Tax=Saccharothrix tamanrassetensis TaxID=1051531 RepID=A0A841CGI7_9PSEU|nr:LCP family protein [Saccharothrix tamanrassetensis]MBB5955135.1 LCP family protein required for cell wall assembly [Saccharothrix tamanrassetensis]